MSIKNVFVRNGDGFGNKVFGLIFTVYLYNLYNKNKNKCKIYYVLSESKHEKKFDPKLYNIFTEAKKKIIFLNDNQYYKINHNPNIKIKKYYNTIKELNELPKYEDLDEYTKFNDYFEIVYKMYNTFSEKDKNIFLNFNENIITDKRVFEYKNLDYSLIHIRYGDKLNLTKKNIEEHKSINHYLFYTTEFYIDYIIKKNDNNNFIIIITDSPILVSKYITNRYLNKNNFIIFNSEWFNEFYLFYYAKKIILSTSTFCFSGAYFNEKSKCLLLLDDNYLNNINIDPELKSISDKWDIIYDKQYILNYNTNLLLEMSKFNLSINNHLTYIKDKLYKNTLKNKLILQYNYKNNKSINSNSYLFNKKIRRQLKYPINKVYGNKSPIKYFSIELLFNKILLENNIKGCIFVTRNMWLPIEKYHRLHNFSSIKIINIYINEAKEHNYNFDDIYIYNQIDSDSFIFFNIKDDYGVEFDFYNDYYMFKINEYLNIKKNLKICILVYTPNMILPYTLNTLKNIAIFSEKYEIIYTYAGITIIFYNITNYNINITNQINKFNSLYNNITYLTNEDIMKEIVYGQQHHNSIASSYFIKFNDKFINNKLINKDINNFNYNIEIINFEKEIINDKFINILLPYIYMEYDRINYLVELYTLENVNNEVLFTEYYTELDRTWNILLDMNTYNLQNKFINLEYKKNILKFFHKNKKSTKTKKYSITYIKNLKKKSKKTSIKLSNIILQLKK